MTETDEKQALGPQPNQGDDDSKHMKNKAIDKVPESTITVSPEAWAREAHLNLSVFRENQNMTYDTLLKEFSSVGKLVEHIRQCEKLLAVHQTRRKLDEAINEADLITELSTYLEQVDIQKMRLELQYQRLKEENLWLAGEQANLKEKLQKLNNELKDAEAEREMRHFIYQMRRGDNEEADTKSRWIERELEEDGYIAELISPKMRGLYHLAIKYISEGRLDVAVAMCSQLLRDRVKTNELKSLDYGVINLLLGIVLRKQNRLTESNANMEDALETFEMEVGDEHPSLTCVLVQLAELNNEMKVYDEAEKYLQRAIVLKRKISGDGRDDVLKLQVDLVATLVNEGKNAEALELCESALKTLLFNYPPRDQMVIRARTLAVKAHLRCGQVDMAYMKAHDIFKECFSKSGGQNIITLLERNTHGKAVTQSELESLYDRIEDQQEIELLKILADIYKALDDEKNFTHVHSLLNNFHIK